MTPLFAGPIYAASRALPERAAMWKALRARGLKITSSWIDEAGPAQTASFSELWSRIEAEIRTSLRLVLYVEADDFPLKGALVEVGMALICGIPVTVIAPGVELEPRSMRPLGSWAAHGLVTVSQEWPADLLPPERRPPATVAQLSMFDDPAEPASTVEDDDPLPW